MKAILVIDMPNGAKAEDYYMMYGLFAHKGEKPFRVGEVAFECKEVNLKPLPQKAREPDIEDEWDESDYYREGWNDCLREITGETE